MKPHRLVTRVLVRDENHRFLLVRNRDQDFWYPPGEGVEPGETLAEAAVREVLEETGVKAKVTRLLFVREFLDSRPDVHNVEIFFLGTLENLANQNPELNYCWFEKKEMLGNASVFPDHLREPDWGGMMEISQNLYLGFERG